MTTVKIQPSSGAAQKRGIPINWQVIIGFYLVTSLGVLVGLGRLINLTFPLGALMVGFYLVRRDPILYIGFNWWLYFLTPFIRRLSDYRASGFTDPSPILLAPYLCSMAALWIVAKHIPNAHRNGGLPFVLSGVGIFYAFLIGLVNSSPVTVIIGLLDWLTPLVFAYYLFLQWPNYPACQKNLKTVFVWGILVMGVYGVIQFLIAPQWEIYWFENAAFGGQGKVAAMDMRVYSTMNSVEPFSAYLAAGLLVLMSTVSPLIVPASIAGYLSFLLSQGRSAWLGWLAGLLCLLNIPKPKYQARIVMVVMVLALCVIPLATMEPFSNIISERVATLSDVENDGSVQARQGTYNRDLEEQLGNILGDGVGGALYDSTLLSCLKALGWIGSTFYISGSIMILYKLFSPSIAQKDLFFTTIRAATMSGLIRLPVNNPMIEISGVCFWAFLGLGLAAIHYHNHMQHVDTVTYLTSEQALAELSQQNKVQIY
jgi:hypothetical protein